MLFGVGAGMSKTNCALVNDVLEGKIQEQEIASKFFPAGNGKGYNKTQR